MRKLNPQKLHTLFMDNLNAGKVKLPRRYTLTHSDFTGDLFLIIGSKYDTRSFSGLYTRLMRDEVLAELVEENNRYILKVYCHVSGGLVFGPASLRFHIFHNELPLALKAIRYGDRKIFEAVHELDKTPVRVMFISHHEKYNKIENWGVIDDYR